MKIHQTQVWGKAPLREKFVILNPHIREQGSHKSNNLRSHLNKPEKDEQKKSKGFSLLFSKGRK
jgi:hypothetical protein